VVTASFDRRDLRGYGGASEGYEQGGWTFEYDSGADGDQLKLDELTAAGAQLLGRVKCEAFRRAWPSREGPSRQRLNTSETCVGPRSSTRPGATTTVIAAGGPEEIAQAEGPVEFGTCS